MTDTAQPIVAAETASSDPIQAAADAFKVYLGQAEAPERPRDEQGRFARAGEPDEEIEADAEEADEAANAEAESHDEEVEDEAADEAQPEAVDLPTSWPAEHAETWNTLPPETQALIVEREGQRDAAVNAKFQEAANLRKANEVEIEEAKTNRQRFAEAIDWVTSLVSPQRPSTSMLDVRSADYNPDAYHLALAEYERTNDLISQLRQQREDTVAQLHREAEAEERKALDEIEQRTRPALLKDVPELSDANKQPAKLQELVRYAIESGIPEYVFTDPEIAKGVTSAQLHITWKARQYDKMMAAKGRVTPKAPKPAAPPVRPGVATSRSAIEAANRKKVTDRLAREGSVEAGAAFFKTLKY